jgi:PucR family transcriptional regulator, purine catabolism regulatory protein
MTAPREEAEAALDLGALEAITDAVESGHGLPEVVRAAARALDASLILIDRSSAVLAVAARSSADERALMADVACASAAARASRPRPCCAS